MIVGGNMEYTSPRPFEAASAKASISFSVDPGEDAEAVASHAGDMARRHVARMLGQIHELSAAERDAAAPIRRGRPVKAPAADTPFVPTAPTVTVDEKGVSVVTLPTAKPDTVVFGVDGSSGEGGTQDGPGPTAQTAASPSEPVPQFMATEPVEITDAALGTALNKKAIAMNDAGGRLLNKFAESFGLGRALDYRTLPQEKRGEFLEKLGAFAG
jgi:hypothetical protein